MINRFQFWRLMVLPALAGLVMVGWLTPSMEAVPADAPAPPVNFQALSSDNNAVVSVSWAVAEGPVAAASYRLERSVDRINWSPVGGAITALEFRDDTVAFAVHYYYRLSAVSAAGKSSAYALADVKTGAFTANSGNSAAGTFKSDDQVVSVQVPAGAMASATAVCSVSLGSASRLTNSLGERPVVAGPYTLTCKGLGGELTTEFTKPVLWTLALKDKLKGVSGHLEAVVVDEAGDQKVIEGAIYDSKTQTMKFNQTAPTVVAVLGPPKQALPLDLITVILTVSALIGGVLFIVVRKSKKQKYDEYVRSKYYNL